MSQEGGGWNVQRSDASLIHRAKTIRSFRLVDIDNDGLDEVLVEAENTAAGYRRWITMTMFSIKGGRLVNLAEIDTLSTNDANHTQYSLEFDSAKTRKVGERHSTSWPRCMGQRKNNFQFQEWKNES